jgi:hypothetical protein
MKYIKEHGWIKLVICLTIAIILGNIMFTIIPKPFNSLFCIIIGAISYFIAIIWDEYANS